MRTHIYYIQAKQLLLIEKLIADITIKQIVKYLILLLNWSWKICYNSPQFVNFKKW